MPPGLHPKREPPREEIGRQFLPIHWRVHWAQANSVVRSRLTRAAVASRSGSWRRHQWSPVGIPSAWGFGLVMMSVLRFPNGALRHFSAISGALRWIDRTTSRAFRSCPSGSPKTTSYCGEGLLIVPREIVPASGGRKSTQSRDRLANRLATCAFMTTRPVTRIGRGRNYRTSATSASTRVAR